MNFLQIFNLLLNLLYYSTGSLAKFHQKLLGENSLFLLHFLMHIHVLMLYRNFELILIKIGIFMNFIVAPTTMHIVLLVSSRSMLFSSLNMLRGKSGNPVYCTLFLYLLFTFPLSPFSLFYISLILLLILQRKQRDIH